MLTIYSGDSHAQIFPREGDSHAQIFPREGDSHAQIFPREGGIWARDYYTHGSQLYINPVQMTWMKNLFIVVTVVQVPVVLILCK